MDSAKEAEDAEAEFRALLDAANQIPIPEPEPEEPAAEYPDAREPNGRRIIVADSDDVARSFRDHVARCSDMMSPALGASCWQ